ncbi:MAG: response regulator [Eubacteriaceae bacterium]|nr:response regulator [Eubacteriaceae bacterium]
MCEDNDINAAITEKLLEKVGCRMDRAENGKIGVDMFSASEPHGYDAVLMDIRMPVMDGLAAARAIRSLYRSDSKTVPIVAMSANAFAEDAEKSISAGMNAHLGKPIHPEKLYETLADLIAFS